MSQRSRQSESLNSGALAYRRGVRGVLRAAVYLRRSLVADRPVVRPATRSGEPDVEIRQGETDVTEREQLTLEVRRDCDLEFLRRAEAFIRDKVEQDTSFFVYFNHSLMHMPVIPGDEFMGRTKQGDWADALLDLTVISAPCWTCSTSWGCGAYSSSLRGDNGPEDALLWRGSAGYWEGSYFAGGDGKQPHPLHRALAGSGSSWAGQRRHHARHRLVQHHPGGGRSQPAE